MHLRRVLVTNNWIQLALVIAAMVLINTWSSSHFFRIDLTADKRYSLDSSTRAIMGQLDKPLYAKVYFTRGLQVPYNNHEQILIDKLKEMQAYSAGLMSVTTTDPTHSRDLSQEAQRFGIEPIQYRYESSAVSELRKVYMGVALVYGDKQTVIPAVTQTHMLEYELARAVRSLLSDEERQTIAYVTGHGEPDLLSTPGPIEVLRNRLLENHNLIPLNVDGSQPIPEDIQAVLVIGPQQPLPDRALYNIDQYLMRGGALGVFLTHSKPDLRTLRAQNIYHGMQAFIGHLGVQINRDLVLDRVHNGQMQFPVRRGQSVQSVQIDYPLIPRATELSPTHPMVVGLDSLLIPFGSSVTLANPMEPTIQAEILASSSPSAGRVRSIRGIEPNVFRQLIPGEERGSWPMVAVLTGRWASYFSGKDIPPAEGSTDDVLPQPTINDGAQARLVVAGSADMVANNLAFMLNMADWLLEDESLIAIRSKIVNVPTLSALTPDQHRSIKAFNLLAGSLILFVFGGIRLFFRRSTKASA